MIVQSASRCLICVYRIGALCRSGASRCLLFILISCLSSRFTAESLEPALQLQGRIEGRRVCESLTHFQELPTSEMSHSAPDETLLSEGNMTTESKQPSSTASNNLEIPAGERRSSPRYSLEKRVRVRPSEVTDRDFEDVRTTLNVSRDSFYFLTELDFYSVGLHVVVSFPYSSEPGAANPEYIGRVVRVARVSDGEFGVAVRLFSGLRLALEK